MKDIKISNIQSRKLANDKLRKDISNNYYENTMRLKS